MVTENKFSSTLYSHLILRGVAGITNARPRFVPHGKQETSDNESREHVLDTVTPEGLSFADSIKART